MLREMRLTYLLHGGSGLDEILSHAQVFEAVTARGAWAVTGDDGYGELAPGSPADMVVLDYDAIAGDLLRADLTGASDLLLGRATKQHVKSVIANGREIVHDGQPSGIDFDALTDEMLAQAAHGMREKMDLFPLVHRFQDALSDYYRAGKHRQVD